MNRFFSSIRLEEGPGHDRIGFWQQGAKNGELVLAKGTGKSCVELLSQHADKVYVVSENGMAEVQEDFLP